MAGQPCAGSDAYVTGSDRGKRVEALAIVYRASVSYTESHGNRAHQFIIRDISYIVCVQCGEHAQARTVKALSAIPCHGPVTLSVHESVSAVPKQFVEYALGVDLVPTHPARAPGGPIRLCPTCGKERSSFGCYDACRLRELALAPVPFDVAALKFKSKHINVAWAAKRVPKAKPKAAAKRK